MPKNPELHLRRGADKRLRGGHCWIYSNEIDSKRSHLGDFTAGDPVNIMAASGQQLGSAYMEPQSLICARMLGRQPDLQMTVDWLRQRIEQALLLRERYFAKPFYRLLYGDSDGVSGVVVDRFGDYLVLQLNTAGAERYQQALLEALALTLKPVGILLRCDSRSRREQGLEERIECALGTVPDRVAVEENGVSFLAPVQAGQKTGWFYDHRNNRAQLQQLCKGQRVLDVYSYVGGWGVQAAAAGADAVFCVDNSQTALELVNENAALNGVEARVSGLHGRADQVMQDLQANAEQFDIVVLDPPAFIQRRRDLGKGRKAYQRINEMALRLLQPGGMLVSASCSMHLPEADLVEAIRAAGRRSERDLRLTGFGGQGADHPVHPAIPETRYLKAVFAAVTGAG
ncbi:MAG: class I SAM-dependent rRNA methyltransferase [Halieaceae bacterium]